MRQIWSVTAKELRGYFSSLVAVLFLGAFLATVLAYCFWVEKFYARNVADVRPLFDALPGLLAPGLHVAGARHAERHGQRGLGARCGGDGHGLHLAFEVQREGLDAVGLDRVDQLVLEVCQSRRISCASASRRSERSLTGAASSIT